MMLIDSEGDDAVHELRQFHAEQRRRLQQRWQAEGASAYDRPERRPRFDRRQEERIGPH